MSGPVFKRLTDGSLRLSDTEEAQRVSREKSITSKQYISLPPQKVLDNAIAEAERLGMNVHDKKLVLGQHRIQFGKYKGQSFRWLVENALGYSAYIVEALARETMVDTPLSHNKFKFKVCFDTQYKQQNFKIYSVYLLKKYVLLTIYVRVRS